jgi:hypothetical protein
MPFERRKPGDPIKHSATETNAFIDAALAHRNEARTVTSPAPTSLPWGMVFVRNDSGADRLQFEVLALDAPLFANDTAGFKQSPAFKGLKPDPENKAAHRSRVAILEGPLAKDAIGRAFIGGQMWMTLQVLDVAHTRARVLDNHKLQSGYFGPVRILGANTTGDNALCRVDIDSWDGGHCWVRVPAGGISGGTFASPSITTCVLAWPHPTSRAITDVASDKPRQVKVVHHGPPIGSGTNKAIQCRINAGLIVPDVEYCS